MDNVVYVIAVGNGLCVGTVFTTVELAEQAAKKLKLRYYEVIPQRVPPVKWGVSYHGIYEYESEEEARRQYALASWDVPAILVKSTDNGKTWINVPVE